MTHANITAAILAVMGEVGYVRKGGRVDMKGQGSYSFAGEADMLRVLRPHMVAAGLVLVPVGASISALHEILEGKYGNRPSRTVRATVTYRLLHTSGESIDLQVCGEGQDQGDKATPKAMTIALKYALRQLFLIETGDDPDRERPEDREPPPRKQSRKEMEAEALRDLRAEVSALLKEAGCGKGDGTADGVCAMANGGADLASCWGSVDALQAVLDHFGSYDTPSAARADAMKE